MAAAVVVIAASTNINSIKHHDLSYLVITPLLFDLLLIPPSHNRYSLLDPDCGYAAVTATVAADVTKPIDYSESTDHWCYTNHYYRYCFADGHHHHHWQYDYLNFN